MDLRPRNSDSGVESVFDLTALAEQVDMCHLPRPLAGQICMDNVLLTTSFKRSSNRLK
jgi:hypothetical protein